ncbi:GNAT family N-acetyltransferase [Thioclava sp. GXIMD4215]|uniref:GNAT family N-acetyltransferase n=1 Tax=Thioclava sp. GXIMD4215 TaxID=3131928 RepID=UPI0032502A45
MSPRLYDLVDATWPAASYRDVGGFTLREGRGAGNRVGSASLTLPLDEADIDAAIAGHHALSQPAIFQVRDGQEPLDAALAARGMEAYDEVVILGARLEDLPQEATDLTAFAHWPPLAIMRELFAQDGIDAARQAVMARAKGPSCVVLGRACDRPAGAAFVACAQTEAMLHALVVSPAFRRQGVARNIMAEAAFWAAQNGAERLSLVVRTENSAALALYNRLGMQPLCRYHYRREVL